MLHELYKHLQKQHGLKPNTNQYKEANNSASAYKGIQELKKITFKSVHFQDDEEEERSEENVVAEEDEEGEEGTRSTFPKGRHREIDRNGWKVLCSTFLYPTVGT